MNKILTFLDGKKTIIAGVITTTGAYLTQIHIMGSITNTFVASLVLLIFGSASIATKAMQNQQ